LKTLTYFQVPKIGFASMAAGLAISSQAIILFPMFFQKHQRGLQVLKGENLQRNRLGKLPQYP
jgi:hypothetical protein